MKSNVAFIVVFLTITIVFSQEKPNFKHLESVITDYHNGFSSKNLELTRNSISNQLNIFNGKQSADPKEWEAHMFISNDEILEWLTWMIDNAGPFKNEVSFKHYHTRANSALVVTSETGSNKFRTWENEEVVYQLGKISSSWKILSFYIKDLKNPE